MNIFLIYICTIIFAATHACRLELTRKNAGGSVTSFYHVLMANMVFFPVVNIVFAITGFIETVLQGITLFFNSVTATIKFIFKR